MDSLRRAVDEFLECKEDIGETEARLSVGSFLALPDIDELLKLAVGIDDVRALGPRERTSTERRNRDLLAVACDEVGEVRARGVVAKTTLPTGKLNGHLEVATIESDFTGLGVALCGDGDEKCA